jgi:hypothetical protein
MFRPFETLLAGGANGGRALAARARLPALAAAFFLCCPGSTGEITIPEPQAKAAFLFSFPKYVEWPPSAFAGPGSPIVISVVGDDQIARGLETIASGKTIDARPVAVHRGFPAADQSCHVLFIGASQKSAAPAILRTLQDRPVLTVGDFESFLDAGMISLATRGTRISFSVNLSPAQRAKLVLNAKLLALAESVRGKSTE